MAKITIDDILASFASTTSINARFQQVEDEFNNKVLYRDNPAGEANDMSNDLDMGNNDILNLDTLNIQSLVINGVTATVTDYTASEVADVQTIADLRLLNGDTALHVSLRGYYDAGDGGGGLFYWDNTSPNSDNGGTVIKPTAVSGNGRWLRIPNIVLNIKEFGASPTKTAAINTPAIQAALDNSEEDTDAVVSVFAPAGKYLVDTIYLPLGINFYGDGAIETTARQSTALVQSTAGQDTIQFKSVLNAGEHFWYGKLTDMTLLGDSTNITGRGIHTKNLAGNDVLFQDTTIIRDVTIRRYPEGGFKSTSGAFPLSMGPMKLLFNNGPGLEFKKLTQYQSIHLLDISGDGNNGGLIRFESLNDGFSSVTITNLKSENRVNADYSNAEHQPNAIVFQTCDNLPVVINGATHASSIPDGANFKKPGDFISVTGTPPSLSWDAVAVRVRATDTGATPLLVGGVPAVIPPPYTITHGSLNVKFRLFNSVQYFNRIVNTNLDTTPSILAGQSMLITNSVATTITDFDDGEDGQLLVISFQDSNTTIAFSGTMRLQGGVDFVSTAEDTLTLIKISTGWREVSRSVN